MDKTVQELAQEERKFLHDLCNHLVVAQGMGSVVLKGLNAQKDVVDPKVLERMEKALKAVEKMMVLTKERRSVLHSVS